VEYAQVFFRLGIIIVLAMSVAPALAGDPSQWGVDGDPS
jgi:hypothetical protein